MSEYSLEKEYKRYLVDLFYTGPDHDHNGKYIQVEKNLMTCIVHAKSLFDAEQFIKHRMKIVTKEIKKSLAHCPQEATVSGPVQKRKLGAPSSRQKKKEQVPT